MDGSCPVDEESPVVARESLQVFVDLSAGLHTGAFIAVRVSRPRITAIIIDLSPTKTRPSPFVGGERVCLLNP